jgi:hypothetical protein
VIGINQQSAVRNQQSKRKPYLAVGSLAALLVLAVYPVYASRSTYRALHVRKDLAAEWDARDRVIRQDEESGVVDVVVKELDHMIPNVSELSTDPGYWYNGCAADYYGVKTIRTVR